MAGEATVLSFKGSDHCLSLCFSAVLCGSTALTEYRYNQTPTLFIVFAAITSAFASTMLVEAMQKIKGNADLRQRWEFCAVVGHYYGRKAEVATIWLFNISLQASNVAAMIVSAQITVSSKALPFCCASAVVLAETVPFHAVPLSQDCFIIYIAGASVALDYGSWPPAVIESSGSLMNPWPTAFVVSAGFLLSMGISIPLGWINLECVGPGWAGCVLPCG
eukprot:SAG22_NODE_659_length_8069_cov_2038.703137_1_plen_220_part_00